VRILNLFVRSGSHSSLHQKENSSHLHPNRPSDQLPWRTPRRTLLDELSAAAYLLAHFEATQGTMRLGKRERIFRRARPRTQRQPLMLSPTYRTRLGASILRRSQITFFPVLCFHRLTSCSLKPIDLQLPSFHALTNCFFRNSFVSIIICVAPCYFRLLCENSVFSASLRYRSPALSSPDIFLVFNSGPRAVRSQFSFLQTRVLSSSPSGGISHVSE